jgi:uncharacterized membrane protein YbjE (DUF340 family)
MWNVLFFLAGGILMGWLLRNHDKTLLVSERFLTIAIFFLLFLLGIKAGSNKNIMGHLGTLGISSLWISLFSIAGSILVVYVITLLIKGPPHEK